MTRSNAKYFQLINRDGVAVFDLPIRDFEKALACYGGGYLRVRFYA